VASAEKQQPAKTFLDAGFGWIPSLKATLAVQSVRDIVRGWTSYYNLAIRLEGDGQLIRVAAAIITEKARRADEGGVDAQIPMRPDQCHLLGDEIGVGSNPAYSYQ
jgi:D-mannonate dehydratase